MAETIETAIHAGSDSLFASYQKLQEKPVIKQEITKRQRLARLAASDDFQAFAEVIDLHIDHLTRLSAITPTDTMETGYLRTLACQLAIEKLKDLKELPERAKKEQKKDE